MAPKLEEQLQQSLTSFETPESQRRTFGDLLNSSRHYLSSKTKSLKGSIIAISPRPHSRGRSRSRKPVSLTLDDLAIEDLAAGSLSASEKGGTQVEAFGNSYTSLLDDCSSGSILSFFEEGNETLDTSVMPVRSPSVSFDERARVRTIKNRYSMARRDMQRAYWTEEELRENLASVGVVVDVDSNAPIDHTTLRLESLPHSHRHNHHTDRQDSTDIVSGLEAYVPEVAVARRHKIQFVTQVVLHQQEQSLRNDNTTDVALGEICQSFSAVDAVSAREKAQSLWREVKPRKSSTRASPRKNRKSMGADRRLPRRRSQVE